MPLLRVGLRFLTPFPDLRGPPKCFVCRLADRDETCRWGAVVEQFEVQDVIDDLFTVKQEICYPRTAAAFTFQ